MIQYFNAFFEQTNDPEHQPSALLGDTDMIVIIDRIQYNRTQREVW